MWQNDVCLSFVNTHTDGRDAERLHDSLAKLPPQVAQLGYGQLMQQRRHCMRRNDRLRPRLVQPRSKLGQDLGVGNARAACVAQLCLHSSTGVCDHPDGGSKEPFPVLPLGWRAHKPAMKTGELRGVLLA